MQHCPDGDCQGPLLDSHGLLPDQGHGFSVRCRRSATARSSWVSTSTAVAVRMTEASTRLSRPALAPVRDPERGEDQQVLGGVAEHSRDSGELSGKHAGDFGDVAHEVAPDSVATRRR